MSLCGKKYSKQGVWDGVFGGKYGVNAKWPPYGYQVLLGLSFFGVLVNRGKKGKKGVKRGVLSVFGPGRRAGGPIPLRAKTGKRVKKRPEDG